MNLWMSGEGTIFCYDCWTGGNIISGSPRKRVFPSALKPRGRYYENGQTQNHHVPEPAYQSLSGPTFEDRAFLYDKEYEDDKAKCQHIESHVIDAGRVHAVGPTIIVKGSKAVCGRLPKATTFRPTVRGVGAEVGEICVAWVEVAHRHESRN